MAYQFTNTESVPEGIRRIVREEIDSAIYELTDKDMDPHEGVHQARKRFKKIRAVLRLTRQELGEVYTREAPRFRDFGRKLSAIRDAEAMIETFDKLREIYKERLEEGELAEVKDNLVRRRQVIAHDEEGLEDRVAEVVAELHEARETLSSWPLATDSFAALAPGLQKIYADGRKRFMTAYSNPTHEHFHDWRKRVKDLWYYGRLMVDIWPQLMGGYIETLHKLSEHLGDDHDLVVFGELLDTQPDTIGGERSIQTLKLLVEERQVELRSNAEKIGHRIYAEKPNNFRIRMQAYWQVWRSEASGAS